MPVYPKEISQLISESKYFGKLKTSNAARSEAKLDCGCFVRIEMLIDETPQRIEEISYRTNGCGYMTAAAESLCLRLSGSSLTELQGQINCGTAFEERQECADTVLNAVRKAFADHRTRTLEEFRGEKALICTCFGVAEETVEEFVRSAHPIDVVGVSDNLRAGNGCGSCRMLIQEIIDANA